MKHGSLFSGIGGFDLAAQRVGWENIFHCENNSFCRQVLKKHFPNAEAHSDIKTTDFTSYRGGVILSQEDSPASHSAKQEKRKEPTIAGTYGQICYEQLEKFNPNTLWGKTFLDSFLGIMEPCINKYALTLKMKDMKCAPSLYQLMQSAPNTKEKEYGLSDVPKWKRIPTPREGSWEKYPTRSKRKGHAIALSYLETMLDYIGMPQYPEFTETLMGFPEGWTDIETQPSGMQSSLF